MKRFVNSIAVVLLLALTAVACSKDDSDASLTFDVPSVYFSAAGQRVVVTYSTHAVDRVYVSTKPKGWDDDHVILDAERQCVTIVMPEIPDDESVVSSGTITISGYTSKNNLKSATLFVGIVPDKELQGPANSFIATEKETNYSFNLVRSDGMPVSGAASVAVLWQSASKLIQYLYFDQATNRVSFYIGADGTHTDEIMRGNALIGAYDADENLLWSWHIWSCDYDPDADAVAWQNGYTMMNRNLGALDDANGTAAEKLASYGLYYQWNRKDPFIGPSDYKFSNGTSASLYVGEYTMTSLSYVESDAETGTEAYATQNPLTFILGVESNGYDWRWNGSTGDWSKLNDPCPVGWRVAPLGAFAGLELEGQPVLDDFEAYGWPLTDGTSSSLFMAGGRRTYLTGYFQNVADRLVGRANTADEAQPWAGHYWTSEWATADAIRSAGSLYFGFDKEAAMNGAHTTAQLFMMTGHYRSNGFSVRCVKE